MKIVLLSIILGVGYWYWSNGQLPLLQKPAVVDGAGNPATWIFTFKDCGNSCSDAIRDLKNRRVPFAEKRLDPDNPDDPNFKLWQQYSNNNNFPVIVVGSESLNGFFAPDIATLLGKTFGETYLTHNEKRFFKKHFNADGSARIVLYGTDWCGYCTKLRKDFRNNKVDFTDIDVEKAPDSQLLIQTMAINGYPATWVGYTRVKNGSEYAAVMALANRK